MKSNKVLHPECFAFFEEHARNMEEEPNEEYKYRVPVPDRSGRFFYSNCVVELWRTLKHFWYKESPNSPSVQGRTRWVAHNL